MTSGDEQRLIPSDVLLERLVDGELDDARRRALLARLDHEPDGWRRCAVAFLEAQCFQQALEGLGRQRDVAPLAAAGQAGAVNNLSVNAEPPAASPEGSVEARRASPRGWSRLARLSSPLATAASFLVALVLGVIVGPRLTGSYGGRPLLTTSPDAAAVAANSTARGQRPDPWQMVTVSLPGGQGSSDSFRVPAIQRDQFDPDWVRSLPGALPPDVLQALQQSGHEVSQVRDVYPIRLRDGRELIVPVDQVEVRPVSARGFQ